MGAAFYRQDGFLLPTNDIKALKKQHIEKTYSALVQENNAVYVAM